MSTVRLRTPRRPAGGTDRALVRAGRRRADRAKFAVAVLAAATFGVGIGLTRQSYTSHPKHSARPLAVPARFERIVHENQLGAGVVAPQQPSPAVQSSTS